MMDMLMITVGAPDPAWQPHVLHYQKLLSPYAKLVSKTVAASPFSSRDTRTRAQTEETTRLLAATPEHADMVVLTEWGKTMTSEIFAQTVATWDDGRTVALLVGGPAGIDRTLLPKKALLLSLSPMTFPHDVAYTLILEQLYRSVTILKGKSYHY